MLLELFKYIVEKPEPSQILLEKLKFSKLRQPKLAEDLVY